jgi:amidase
MTATRLDAFAPATEMLRALRARDVSAVELLDLHLRRIERYDPALNAIVTTCFDDARRAAEAADAARTRGEDKPLLGLPLTIKDCIDVAGLRGTAGVTDFADRCPEADSLIAARVRAAGGVLLGKTNVPPFAGDWQADNPIFGRTNNPWDLERTPGGSTGGGGAALAAGLTPLEFGSDIGGSIRVPAAFCGVYGHRPSETALPRSGHFPGRPLPNSATVMGVQGPLARTAEDLELALDVVAGPDVGEDVAWRLQIPPSRHEQLTGFRVAVLPSIPWLPVDAEISAALDGLASKLARAGATIGQAQPETFDDLREYQSLYLSLLTVMTNVETSPDARRSLAEAAKRAVPGDFGEAQARGFEAGAADYITWIGRREAYRAAYREFFREWDVLLAPAFLTPAFPHIALDVPFGRRIHTVNGQDVPYILGTTHPALATLCGQPATAFPVGLTSAGLPIGLQVIGPYLEDRTPIRFAALVARAFGGFQRPPGYDQ